MRVTIDPPITETAPGEAVRSRSRIFVDGYRGQVGYVDAESSGTIYLIRHFPRHVAAAIREDVEAQVGPRPHFTMVPDPVRVAEAIDSLTPEEEDEDE